MVKEKIRESSEGTSRRMGTEKGFLPREQRLQTDGSEARVPGIPGEDGGSEWQLRNDRNSRASQGGQECAGLVPLTSPRGPSRLLLSPSPWRCQDTAALQGQWVGTKVEEECRGH